MQGSSGGGGSGAPHFGFHTFRVFLGSQASRVRSTGSPPSSAGGNDGSMPYTTRSSASATCEAR